MLIAALLISAFVLKPDRSIAQLPPGHVLRAMADQLDTLRADFAFFQAHSGVEQVVDVVTGEERVTFPDKMPAAEIAEYKYRNAVRHGVSLNMNAALARNLDTATRLLRCVLEQRSEAKCGAPRIHFEPQAAQDSLPAFGTFLQVLVSKWNDADVYLLFFDTGRQHLRLIFKENRLIMTKATDDGEFAHFHIYRKQPSVR